MALPRPGLIYPILVGLVVLVLFIAIDVSVMRSVVWAMISTFAAYVAFRPNHRSDVL